MNAIVARRVIWALPLSGVFVFVPWFFFLGHPNARNDLDGYARWITSPAAAFAVYVYVVGLLLLLFGLLGLYSQLTSSAASGWATAGMIPSVSAVALLLPIFGILALATPTVGDVYLAGHPDVAAAVLPLSGGNLGGRLNTYAWVVVVISAIGGIATAVALNSALGRRWAGPLFAIAFVLTILSIPFLTHAGAVLLVLAGGWIARELGSHAPVSVGAGVRPTPA